MFIINITKLQSGLRVFFDLEVYDIKIAKVDRQEGIWAYYVRVRGRIGEPL